MANGLFDNVYNPDVLSCLANLSNDEVFTPPEIVNQMLDMLPQDLFRNPDTTFLDPACKTGVFLREIAKRLIEGLEPQYPDLQERIDHIFHPYGFDVRVEGSYKRIKPVFSLTPFKGSVKFYYNGWRKEGVGYMDRKSIHKNEEMIDKYKIFVPKAWGTGDPSTDLVNAFIVEPNSASTETYLTVGPFETNEEANNALAYMHTKFFHFMVSMIKITQNAMKNIYTMVPLQSFDKEWSDNELYQKYNLSDDEVRFIETTIRSYDEGGSADAD